MEGIVKVRNYTDDVIGILNGLDTERNNPATDPALPHHFSAASVAKERPLNKAALQAQLSLPIRPDVPLIGIVSRLTAQKGFDLALPALWTMLAEDDIQVVVLGSGESAQEYEFRLLDNRFPDKLRAIIGYDGILAQRIYGGTDLFLMPSRYEPCGTSQMLAMRYGSLPIVRETGGLADTVQNYDGGDGAQGTGFIFLWETPDAVLNTTRWAVTTYRNNPKAFARMQQRGMTMDFSWDKSAGEYIAVYERAMAKHR